MNQDTLLQIVPPAKVWNDPPTPPRRERLWLAAGGLCHWCGQPTRMVSDNSWDKATIDHVIPRWRGGSNEEVNCVLACNLCNSRRNYEDHMGLAEGSMLGKYKGQGAKIVKSQIHRGVALTADDKKALMARIDGTHLPRVKVSGEDVLREQRDQAHKELLHLRRELKHYEAVVKTQEEELRALTVWQLFRRRLAERLAKWIRGKEKDAAQKVDTSSQ
jgi:5-methylcytosine-specific restriction endonuclease McrA